MGNNVAVTVIGSSTPYTVSGVRILQHDGEHEIALVDLVISPTARLWDGWTPLRIQWGTAFTRPQIFVGYVHDVSYERKAGSQLTNARVTAVGATMPMKTQSSRIWTSRTTSYVAGELASKYGLRAVVDPTRDIVPNIAQSGESDWAFIARQAVDSGYNCFARGTTIFFIDPLRVLRNPRWNSPTFEMTLLAGGGSSVLSFTPREDSFGTAQNPSAVDRQALGIDARSGRLVGATSSGLPAVAMSAIRQGRDVAQTSDAERIVASGARRSAQWVRACATLQGHSALQPATTLNLTGTGIAPAYTGIWLVTGAEHDLQYNAKARRWDYTVAVELARDRVYAATYSTDQAWARVEALSATQLVAGRWVAGSTGRLN